MSVFVEDKYYRLVFEYSLDAIMLTGPDGKIYRANNAACQMLDMTEEEIINIGRYGIVDETDPAFYPALKEREKNGMVDVELMFVKKDGTKFPVHLTSAIFKDEEGRSRTVVIARDISINRKYQETIRARQSEIENMAMNDFLTGVLNRKGFLDKINEIVTDKKAMSLIMIDLDDFKKVNDTYGHLNGDYILKKIAEEFRSKLRNSDFIGRFGGDEFIVCLPDTVSNEALEVAERLRASLESLVVPLEKGSVSVTASFGVAYNDSGTSDSIDDMILRADDNMYKAKTVKNSVYRSI